LEKRLKTKPFGEINIDERQIISFPDGILGFDYIKAFILLDSGEANSPFKWLQAYEEESLAFIIIMPCDFMESYDPEIPRNDLEAIGFSAPEEPLVFSIVTIPEDPLKMTANLQGPIIINPEKRLGRQSISMNERYSVRHLILEEMKKPDGRGG
jgi:flagellar assembly factor FliW